MFVRLDLSSNKLTLNATHEVITHISDKVPLQLMAPGRRDTPAKTGEFFCRDTNSLFDFSYVVLNHLKADFKLRLVTASAAGSPTGFELYVFDV